MAAVCNVRAATVSLRSGQQTYTVVDDAGAVIEDVEAFLRYLRGNSASANTIESYASHLALLMRWLTARRASWERS